VLYRRRPCVSLQCPGCFESLLGGLSTKVVRAMTLSDNPNSRFLSGTLQRTWPSMKAARTVSHWYMLSVWAKSRLPR